MSRFDAIFLGAGQAARHLLHTELPEQQAVTLYSCLRAPGHPATAGGELLIIMLFAVFIS